MTSCRTTEPPGPTPLIDEQWERVTCAGAVAYRAGHRGDSLRLWTQTADLIRAFEAGDPRRAAALNNLGLARLLAGDPVAGRDALDAAAEAWEQSDAWLAALTPRGRARSSQFHLRLETRHRAAYARHNRARDAVMLAGAAAATDFNRAVARGGQGPAVQATIRHALARRQRAFGPRNPELAPLLTALRGDEPSAADRDRRLAAIARDPARGGLERWHQESARHSGDARRFWAAVLLTQVSTRTRVAQEASAPPRNCSR